MNEQPSQLEPRHETPRRSSWRVRLMAVFLGCAVAIGLAELSFRLFIPVTDVAFQFWDPVVGVRRKPNQQGRNIAGSSINVGYHFNAQGWNYPSNFTIRRTPGTMRICLIGDSYIEAMQVDCDKNMAVVAERALRDAGRPTEVYPFGCSGLGTAHEYLILRHYALDYRPDLVIFFITQNDVYDCSPYLVGIESWSPSYFLDESDRLVLLPSYFWERSPLRRMMARLALTRYFLIQKRLLDRLKGPQGPGGIVRREMTGVPSERYLGENLSEAQRDAKSWLLIEKLLEASRDECAHAGARFAVVFRGHLEEIKAAERGTTYSPPAREVDPYCMNERIHEMGRDYLEPMSRRLNIAYLDLTLALVEAVKKSGQMHNFPDDDHYNALGHETTGRAMADWAADLLAQQSR